MDQFIHFENIRHYRKLLEEELNEEKRNILQKLLAEEEAKPIAGHPADPADKSEMP